MNRNLKIVLTLYTVLVFFVSTLFAFSLTGKSHYTVFSQETGWCTSKSECDSLKWGACNGGYTHDTIWTQSNNCGTDGYFGNTPAGYCVTDVNTCNGTSNSCAILWHANNLNASFSITNCEFSKTFEFKVHSVSAPAGSSDQSCIGTTVANPVTVNLGNGTYDPRNFGNGCGQCVQIDRPVGSEFEGGVAAYSGDCPVDSKPIKCYRCTQNLNDGNTCESRDFETEFCPTGWTNNSKCEEVVGGYCPVFNTLVCNQICDPTETVNKCGAGLSCLNQNGENRCRLPSNPTSETCSQIVVNPGIRIVKEVTERSEYLVGEYATFQITITNTGNTTLDNVRFSDQFNASYLRYTSGNATKSNGNSISNITQYLNVNTNGHLVINNLASTPLGNLGVNESYNVYLRFLVLAPFNNTCNVGVVLTSSIPEMRDDACISSRNRNTDL